MGMHVFDFVFTLEQRLSNTINVFGRVEAYAVFGSVIDTAFTKVFFTNSGSDNST
jgi:hypothetical protein